MVQAGPNYTEHLLSVGAERVGKCRNELPFGENDFRRSAGVETGEPKRLTSSTTLRIGEASLDIYARCDMNQLKLLVEILKAFLLTNIVKYVVRYP